MSRSSKTSADGRSEQLHVRCRPELKERLEDRAWDRRETISEYVRGLIRADLDGADLDENDTDAETHES